MKAIVVLFDSLSKEFLPPYGNDWVHAPNFTRLAERSVTFNRCFVGSMPCMPARRELHTGRYNFLHRSWGPLEPFDDSMPAILSENGVYTHLTTDHYHYWEDGNTTYQNRYSSYEMVRGQEGDKWKGEVKDPDVPEHLGSDSRQDWVNRKYMQEEKDTSQARTFDLGLEFIEKNCDQDSWFLQIECFDPHPPFVAPQKYRDLYPHDYDGPLFDWPTYGPVEDGMPEEAIEHCRKEYAAVVSMCDNSLGRVMDAMDRHDMWDDTMLIVTTDHGFLLGEHQWWAFCKPPFYGEIANKPMFAWDPRCGRTGARNSQLVQIHDLPPTLLEYFGVDIPPDMLGKPLRETIASDSPVHDAILYGVFGGHVNCTDGKHVYMRAPASAANQPLFNYTLMPTHMKRLFDTQELSTMELAPPFSFTKGVQTMKTKGAAFMAKAHSFGTLLFDLENDPLHEHPIEDAAAEKKMIAHLLALMKENDAPGEQYERLGLLETAVSAVGREGTV